MVATASSQTEIVDEADDVSQIAPPRIRVSRAQLDEYRAILARHEASAQISSRLIGGASGPSTGRTRGRGRGAQEKSRAATSVESSSFIVRRTGGGGEPARAPGGGSKSVKTFLDKCIRTIPPANQTTIHNTRIGQGRQEESREIIALRWYKNMLPFTVFSNGDMQLICDAAIRAGPGFRAPSLYEVNCDIL